MRLPVGLDLRDPQPGFQAAARACLALSDDVPLSQRQRRRRQRHLDKLARALLILEAHNEAVAIWHEILDHWRLPRPQTVPHSLIRPVIAPPAYFDLDKVLRGETVPRRIVGWQPAASKIFRAAMLSGLTTRAQEVGSFLGMERGHSRALLFHFKRRRKRDG